MGWEQEQDPRTENATGSAAKSQKTNPWVERIQKEYQSAEKTSSSAQTKNPWVASVQQSYEKNGGNRPAEAPQRMNPWVASVRQKYLPYHQERENQRNQGLLDTYDFIMKTQTDLQKMAGSYQDADSFQKYREETEKKAKGMYYWISSSREAAGRIADDQQRAEYGKMLDEMENYLHMLPKDLETIQAHWKQWDSQEEYDVWKRAVDAQERLEEMQKQRDAALKRKQLGVGESLDYVVPTDEEYRAAAAQAQEAAKAAQPSAEKLRKMIAEREEQIEEKKKGQNVGKKILDWAMVKNPDPEIADLESQLTAYKEQLYYTEHDEELAQLSPELQAWIEDYTERHAKSKLIKENGPILVVKGEEHEKKFLAKNGKRYSANELLDNLDLSDYDQLVEEINAAGFDGKALIDYVEYRQGQEYVEQYTQGIKDQTASSPAWAAVNSALSILATPVTIRGFLDTAKTNISNAFTGEDRQIDLSNDAYLPSLYQSSIREQVSDDIEASTGSEVATFLYTTGMSMGDWLTLAPLSLLPGGKAASRLLMGGGAATDTAIDITNRGGTASQAFWGGLAAGAAEAIFEKYSLDAFLKPKNVGSVITFIVNLLKGAGIEGAEEFATEVTNILTDQLIMGDKSHYSLNVQAYKNSGLSREEAEKAALKDLVKQVGLALAGGALSGGVIHGTQSGLNYAQNHRIGSDILQNGQVHDAIRAGFESEYNSPAYQAAVSLSEQMVNGEAMSPTQIGMMVTDARMQAQTPSYTAQTGTKASTAARQSANLLRQLEAYRPRTAVDSAETRVGQRYTPMDDGGVRTAQGDSASWKNGGGTPEAGLPVSSASYRGDGSINQSLTKLYAAAAEYDTQTAKAFVAGYSGTLPVESYRTAFRLLYTQGMERVPFETAVKQAGAAGQKMGLKGRYLAYQSGVNAAALSSGRVRGMISAERSGEYGGEDTGAQAFLGFPFRRRNETDSKRSGISGKTPKKNRGSQAATERIDRTLGGRRVVLEAVREDRLSAKQRAETEIARVYGYELYHVPAGSEIQYGDRGYVMEGTAFILPGIPAVFAQDGTTKKYIHHELFHQFLRRNLHGEGQLLESVQRRIRYDGQEWADYESGCEQSYGSAVSNDRIYDEITADLCEYAKSGSREMYNRLAGLFEEGWLNRLAEQAREVFEANRVAVQAGQGSQTAPLSEGEGNDLFSSFLSGMDGRTPSSDSSLPNGADGGRIELEGGRTYGLQETEEFRGDGSGVYGGTGGRYAGGTADRGAARETGGMEPDVSEYDPGRADRVESEGRREVEGSVRRYSSVDHHGQSSIAYEPVKKLLPDSPAGRAAQIMQDSGIRVVVTDGAFETGRGGQSVPHTEAVTAPDGTVYVSSAAQIPAERIAAHESVHVLQNQNSPLYETYWDEIQFQLNSQSQAYEDIAGKINDKHYQGRIDLDDPDSIRRISRELTAHLHEWLETDPAFAREIFGDLFFDWDAVVRADRALTEGMKAFARTGTAPVHAGYGEGSSDELFSSFLSGMEGRRFEPDSDLPTHETNGRMETGSGAKVPGKVVRTSSADDVNNWWKTEMGYEHPPYQLGTKVSEIRLTKKTTFVRVYDGETSGQFGGWMMQAEDIQGLTASQIQDKFALPSTPKYITDVILPEGTVIRKGIVNSLEDWGTGGGIQYDLMGQRIGEFVNPRPLE